MFINENYRVKRIGLDMENLENQIKVLEKEANDLRISVAALMDSEEAYRQFFEKVFDALIVFDIRSQKIEDVNFSALQLFGFSKEELVNRPFRDICSEKGQTFSAVLNGISKVSKEKQIITGWFIKKNRTSFPGSVYVASIELRDEEKIFVSVRDISEKLKIEETLRKSQEQLFQAQKMEALGILVAGVAHEINNPINLIIYNVPLIQGIWRDLKPVLEASAQKNPNVKYGGLTYAFIDENLDQLIADMDMAAKRVETIVRRLKDFARKSSSRDKSDVSINEAVENALRLAQSTFKKSKVSIHTTLCDEIPMLRGHLHSIEQVVLNLVINAVEAIDHDFGEIHISSAFAENEKIVIVTVRDNGKGMPPETVEKIFDPFFTEKQASGGTGLGLSVSYSLIQSHEGDITCRSEPGKGTVFEIRLPLEPEKKPIKVLIADDDPALRKLIFQVLKREGNFLIEMASNGTETLIKMGAFLPDVLVLDLFMPQMNGLEVCQAIIKEKKLAQMKVIIITGMPNSPEIAEIKKIGFMNIYSKPIDIKGFAQDVIAMFQKDGF